MLNALSRCSASLTLGASAVVVVTPATQLRSVTFVKWFATNSRSVDTLPVAEVVSNPPVLAVCTKAVTDTGEAGEQARLTVNKT